MSKLPNNTLIVLMLVVISTLLMACGSGVVTDTDDGLPGVRVSNQQVNDVKIVYVDEVVSETPGWLVVYKVDENLLTGEKRLGDELGRVAVSQGKTTRIKVNLDRAAGHGQELYAVLYQDRGLVGSYEKGIDPIALDRTGSEIKQLFIVTLSEVALRPAISGLIKASLTTQLFVEGVSTDEDAWLLVQRKSGASFGAVIGQAYVPRGAYERIFIDLDASSPMGSLSNYEFRVSMVKSIGNQPASLDDPDSSLGVRAENIVSINTSSRLDNEIADIRFVVKPSSSGGYEFLSVEPARYTDDLVVTGVINPQLTLIRGKRYEFVVQNSQANPMRFFYDANGNVQNRFGYEGDSEVFFDMVFRDTQNSSRPGAMKSTSIHWEVVPAHLAINQSGETVRFRLASISNELAPYPTNIMNGYECSVCIASFTRGDIILRDQ